jgi:CMP-2-keto-3-deoxyoctulosonic acid synthetase
MSTMSSNNVLNLHTGNPLKTNQIFAVTAAQRRIEDTSRQKTRRARRNAELRPPTAKKVSKSVGAKSAVDYSRAVIPYKGEEW